MTAVAAPIHFTMRAVVDEEDGSTSRRCRERMNVTMLAPALSFSFADHTFRFADSELKSVAVAEDTRTRLKHRLVAPWRRDGPRRRGRLVGSEVAESFSEVIAWKL